ncbi:MAG: beta-ketoacyl synthase N-terminal-like domain-containing protein [Chloroflexota bacterium]
MSNFDPISQPGREQPDEIAQSDGIAIIGMVGRFPGARTLEEFWQNLRDGVEAVTFFSEQELRDAGVPDEWLHSPHYVKAQPVLDGIDLFDAAFFKISPREAEVMDPQHRILLECSWEALEQAGYNPETFPGRIGVYAGAEQCHYLFNLFSNQRNLAGVNGLQFVAGTDRGYLCTRISYALNLNGPSVTLLCSCSTSLVAIHTACESLRNGECDIALAGGVALSQLGKGGYFHEPGSVLSPDGHCRAFDADAHGTVFGSGVGVLVLKRLSDALESGDTIHALIRGSAINNDGSAKIGYMAPGVDGQASVVAEALGIAGVDPATVGYIETHGTGTELGDPIEIAGLKQAFGQSTDRKGFCAIGSLKTNVGHLAVASGVAGVIKTVLALENRQIPPSLHFKQPNPQIDFADSPFYVNTALREWLRNGAPRRAGVSSFGMGGTNAHAVLEEAPEAEVPGNSRPWHLLLLSAKTGTALEKATTRLAEHLRRNPGLTLADVAYTLQVGRQAFTHRRALVCRDMADALAALEKNDQKRILTFYQENVGRPQVWMFPGLGDHYPDMALGLYHAEPMFRKQVDRCCELLQPLLGLDLRTILLPGLGKDAALAASVAPGETFDLRKMLGRDQRPADEATRRLNQTQMAHPAAFVVEYALARLLMSWGLRPAALVGHSLGEYVAACLAGVLNLQDALTLVARRAQLIQDLPAGAMLAVMLSEEQVQSFLSAEISLSAINGPSMCVLAGAEEPVASLEKRLLADGIACRRLQTTHAFHSHMLDAIVEPLTQLVGSFRLKAPAIPYISNLTGAWITPDQATDPAYWAKHTRNPVRFADSLQELLQDPLRVFLEVGPGRSMSSMALQHPASGGDVSRVVASLRHAYEQQDDLAFLLNAVAQLWVAGAAVDWDAFSKGKRQHRIPLPAYPFERQRYWVEAGPLAAAAVSSENTSSPTGDVGTTNAPGADAPAAQAHAYERPNLPNDYVEPDGDTEAKLADIWQQLLGIQKIGRDDNVFRIGAHSLIAMQVVNRLRDTFDVDLQLGTAFEAPTIAELAERIEAARKAAQKALPPIAVIARSDGTPLPVSCAQQTLWELQALARPPQKAGLLGLRRQQPPAILGSVILNVCTTLRFSGKLDAARLARALSTIVQRHEALRTRFALADGRLASFAADAQPVTLPVVNVPSLPAEKLDAYLWELVAAQQQETFKQDDACLWRVQLVRLDADEHRLIWCAHRSICDETSLEILAQELVVLYRDSDAAAMGQPGVQYADFAAWQQQWLREERIQAHLDYWKGRLLSSLPVLRLPSGWKPAPSTHLATAAFDLSPELSGAMHTLSQNQRTSLFVTLLAAFNLLLFQCTGQQDILIGAPATNRNRSELEGLIGLFDNILALRCALSDEQSFLQLLGQVHQTVLEAQVHQDVPFEMVLKMLLAERNPKVPLLQVMFSLENEPARQITLPDLTLEIPRVSGREANCDLILAMKDTPDGLRGVFEYNRDLLQAATIERLVVDFKRLLQAVVVDPSRPLVRFFEEKENV